MSIFTKLTQRYLSKNKTRTIVTLIGIIVSMALFTAVIEGAYSGYQFLKNREIAVTGQWQVIMNDVNQEGLEEAKTNKQIDQYENIYTLGWAKVDNENDGKPYLLVQSLGDTEHALFPINLVSGHMPEKEDEILLPENFIANAKEKYQVGDTITLETGQRFIEKQQLSENTPYQEKESLKNTTKHTFTIVGIMERLPFEIEEFSCPGYTCITNGFHTDSQKLFVTIHSPSKMQDFLMRQTISDSYVPHSDLLRFYGAFKASGERSVLIGLTTILVLLIAYGSISLIYNSFSISISERIRQFGIMRSIGASNRQIRRMVLFEAFLLAIIGIVLGVIVGCVGIGVTLAWVQHNFIVNIANKVGVGLRLVISPLPIFIAVMICLVTTIVAAYIPAYKAIHKSAIEAIRQSDEIIIKPNEVKTSKLTQKMFGFAGVMATKNFKRNKRKYRSTILSLALSVILFISAASLTQYVNKMLLIQSSNDHKMNVMYNAYTDEQEDVTQRFNVIKAIPEIQNIAITQKIFDEAYIQRNYIASEYWTAENQQYLRRIKDAVGVNVELVFVDDDAFKNLCKQNKIDSSSYFDKNSPKGLLYNHVIQQFIREDKGITRDVSVIDTNANNVPMFVREYKQIEGYASLHEPYIKDGKQYYLFYPIEYIEEMKGYENLDMRKAKLYPVEEIDIDIPLVAGAQIEENLFTLSRNTMQLIYPRSMATTLFENTDTSYIQRLSNPEIGIQTDNHASVAQQLEKIQKDNGWSADRIYDFDRERQNNRMFILVINVFSYGFILLIGVISIANVFNTISTNIILRRKEFAMLRSVGMSEKGFQKMLNYECLIYGGRSLAIGLPISFIISFFIHHVINQMVQVDYFIPYVSVLLAIAMVFVVVFITMLYTTRKIRRNNVIEELRIENI
ncbi:FtsX-like permease family protein [uncultured Solobacterium sp.]|uniref:ABC transporter permease n=1 Tax=uncultured Solobacterium sp. TaxID=747375 RepID=UPI0028D728CC|nr:FtsX-like permease family protein [uncultured Solobacterium sp.]